MHCPNGPIWRILSSGQRTSPWAAVRPLRPTCGGMGSPTGAVGILRGRSSPHSHGIVVAVPRVRHAAVAIEVVQHLVDGPGVVIVEFLDQECHGLREVTHSDTVNQCKVQDGTVSDVDAI